MTSLSFDTDDQGNLVLSGKVFRGEDFDELAVTAPHGHRAIISDTQFLDCTTTSGTCLIDSSVELHRVMFSNLDCGDAIRISSSAVLDEVTVTGSKPSALIVQPDTKLTGQIAPVRNVAYQLDVSEYEGECVIVGIPGDLVRRNANRQICVHGSWNTRVDWTDLGIGPFSFLRIFLKKLSSFGASEGVFSLPEPSSKYHNETMDELRRLRDSGLEVT